MKDKVKKNDEEMRELSLNELDMVAGGGRRGKASGGFNEGCLEDNNNGSWQNLLYPKSDSTDT